MSSPVRKSSYSNTGGGNCLAAGTDDRGVLVLDTKSPGPVLSISPAAWTEFVATLK
jgi:hypothetical protein